MQPLKAVQAGRPGSRLTEPLGGGAQEPGPEQVSLGHCGELQTVHLPWMAHLGRQGHGLGAGVGHPGSPPGLTSLLLLELGTQPEAATLSTLPSELVDWRVAAATGWLWGC